MELEQLRQTIDAHISEHHRSFAAAPTAQATAQIPNFCTLWPTAKPILSAVAAIVVLIPSVGTAAGPILTGLMEVGDQIYSSTCQPKKP